MAEVEQVPERHERKRRTSSKKKQSMAKKRKMKIQEGAAKKLKIDKKMKKLFQKRARDYNSDDDDEELGEGNRHQSLGIDEGSDADSDGAISADDVAAERNTGIERNDVGVSDDEDDEIQPGVMKFTEGIHAFKLAFKKIVKKSGEDDVLGPVLSAHKKLIAEKLAEDEAERKVKGEVKKEKHLVREKGHVKPANYLDAHEKFLLGVATKGVVKLFNAVSKSQSAQKGLNPSRSKDEKVIKKRRKDAFFSELSKTGTQSVGTVVKVGEAPAWAPLRDNYMLTNPKLKDWDKIQDTNVADDMARQSESDSSDDE